ncbi:RNA polymerase sigma-70 family protein [Mycolicibacterium fortuitum subsp. acetamidolyticum]|uniref:RNA polymerase sigma-70 family protein n=1 Tax=Mycolicibacterium fortuitum subsp. acetamidolyticum TaxID=144550 RepID=A0A100WQ47_MYCFO|nr:hypothetical protein [Mycolicibacterium fortuitum]MCV7137651.1 hypothetical protein [Mycolicibacterium fortuitum]GAT02518.1 RNA polymerase sigma-70 family protein [Mycolicibacterium fortuitum subsp. acetamidolyticum]
MNPHLEPFLLRGAPDPLAGHTCGTHATISRRGTITVIGDDTIDPWTLTAQACWPDNARIYPTPWVVAALTHDDDLLVLNLARVDHTDLPADMARGLQLQAEQFCSTAPHRWAKTTTVKATYTHDAHLVVGGYSLPAPTPLSTSKETFDSEIAKTFSDLPPKRRRIALLLHRYDGLTLDQLAAHFAEPNAPAEQLRTTRAALQVEFTRLRRHPGITLRSNAAGVYTISRIDMDDSRGMALAR